MRTQITSMKLISRRAFISLCGFAGIGALSGCTQDTEDTSQSNTSMTDDVSKELQSVVEETPEQTEPTAEELRANLALTEDYRDSFDHGEKGPEYQKYIVLHDTEGTGDAASVISWWDSNGAGVAAHFVVNTDGTMMLDLVILVTMSHLGYPMNLVTIKSAPLKLALGHLITV